MSITYLAVEASENDYPDTIPDYERTVINGDGVFAGPNSRHKLNSSGPLMLVGAFLGQGRIC